MVRIAPSVLSANFGSLSDDIKSVVDTGADLFHLDIMDGHFVPNISFGPAIVNVINNTTEKFLDVHLMLSEPEKYFEPFVKAGADNITFHIEVHPNPTKHAKRLHELGIQAGISLNPPTELKAVLPYIEQFELLLVMSVNPGFGGQKFIESAIPKIAEAREFIDKHGLRTKIEVDGGVDANNAKRIADAGADILVMGNAFFGSQNRADLVKLVHNLK